MKEHNVAILGFGVVGGGVAKLLCDNREQIENYTGQCVKILHILDIRDFEGSPFADLITKDFGRIVADERVDTVFEVMGGSHPAYEYTVAALKAKKNVITSNKEVVANFGDEFVALAKENGVSYRFEAAVGGGIPLISPMINCLRQNRLTEIRGILNGTTNYILTKMFDYGESFADALADAQAKGYAESNPAADVLGTDAARKITILTALGTGKLLKVDALPVEGITGIRAEDVVAAEQMGCKIKLLGRCIATEGEPYVMVAPFIIPASSPLGGVSGVYNAVEFIGEPLGNVMFYGPGAGAGATASAVVGDLIPLIAGEGGVSLMPDLCPTDYSAKEAFASFKSRHYVALKESCKEKLEQVFSDITLCAGSDPIAFVTAEMSEAEFDTAIAPFKELLLSHIRLI